MYAVCCQSLRVLSLRVFTSGGVSRWWSCIRAIRRPLAAGVQGLFIRGPARPDPYGVLAAQTDLADPLMEITLAEAGVVCSW